jgi:hypothetical protein
MAAVQALIIGIAGIVAIILIQYIPVDFSKAVSWIPGVNAEKAHDVVKMSLIVIVVTIVAWFMPGGIP